VPDLSEDEVREAITDPDAQVTEGFAPGLMPRYGDSLSEEQVDALVQYLMEVAGQ
jgi:mono/diheme cytochrome c family protein